MKFIDKYFFRNYRMQKSPKSPRIIIDNQLNLIGSEIKLTAVLFSNIHVHVFILNSIHLLQLNSADGFINYR